MFNARQDRLAIRALGARRFLVNALRLENSTRSTHSSQGMSVGIVGMTSLACPTIVRHDEGFKKSEKKEEI